MMHENRFIRTDLTACVKKKPKTRVMNAFVAGGCTVDVQSR